MKASLVVAVVAGVAAVVVAASATTQAIRAILLAKVPMKLATKLATKAVTKLAVKLHVTPPQTPLAKPRRTPRNQLLRQTRFRAHQQRMTQPTVKPQRLPLPPLLKRHLARAWHVDQRIPSPPCSPLPETVAHRVIASNRESAKLLLIVNRQLTAKRLVIVNRQLIASPQVNVKIAISARQPSAQLCQVAIAPHVRASKVRSVRYQAFSIASRCLPAASLNCVIPRPRHGHSRA